MSGGGALKAAAKVANSGFRSGFTPDHPVCAAARKAVRPVTVFAGSSAPDDGRGSLVLSNPAVESPSVQRRSCSEFDDWEFPDVDENPRPRLVFGGAPTLQEAKEATSDLKEAIENVFMSPGNKIGGSRATVADLFSNSNDLETKTCVSNTKPTPMNGSAFRAFMLLCESSAAQNVVASIASDPSVHKAVMENPELHNFLVSRRISAECVGVEESVAENDPSPQQAQEASRSTDKSKGGSQFGDFFRNMKVAVVDMINSLSDYLESIFGGGYNVEANADGSAKMSGVDKAIGASFLGLAVMVIMVVLLKRP